MYFKHCNSEDQLDTFENFLEADGKQSMHSPDLLKAHTPNQSHIDFLSAIGVTFPIRNKAKSINTNIVNYQFEGGAIKQEQFMLEFDFY